MKCLVVRSHRFARNIRPRGETKHFPHRRRDLGHILLCAIPHRELQAVLKRSLRYSEPTYSTSCADDTLVPFFVDRFEFTPSLHAGQDQLIDGLEMATAEFFAHDAFVPEFWNAATRQLAEFRKQERAKSFGFQRPEDCPFL
jgi:hypothetical protein